MFKQLVFGKGKVAVSLSRSGERETVGILLSDTGSQVHLQPLASDGSVMPSSIGVPPDPATLREMADLLSRHAYNLEEGRRMLVGNNSAVCRT